MSEKKAKILVVDDQPDIVETVSFCLEQEGYEVLTGSDGEQALSLARSEHPDLMILDVMMPKENGYQVSRFIREDEKEQNLEKRMVVMLLTARTVNEPEREEFILTWSGADRMLYKPFELEELVSEVANELEKASTRQVSSGQ